MSNLTGLVNLVCNSLELIDETTGTPSEVRTLIANNTVKGQKGDTGVTGAQGITGQKGDRGETLVQTMSGPVGDKGEKGQQGLIGAAGQKGDRGYQGIAGNDGAKGDKGDGKGDAKATGLE